MVKSRAFLTYALIAATLFVTLLVYNADTLRDVAASGKARFQKDKGNAELVDIGSPASSTHSPDEDEDSAASESPLPTALSTSTPSKLPQPPLSPPELAIATFLSSAGDADPYFNSTRLLAYQLLHAPYTRFQNPNITFAVLCGKKVSEEKKERLRKDGATVIPVDDVELPSWMHINTDRYVDTMTKLRIFERTEFKRLLLIDSDFMIMHPMDEIFEDPLFTALTPTQFARKEQIKEDEGPLPKEWLFAARIENGHVGGFEHTVPPLQDDYANSGFIMIAPDKAMYEHLLNVMQFEGRFPMQFPDQDILNYVFRREGPMPWREIHWKWSSNFVNEKDVEFGVHALHMKPWLEGPQAVRDRWSKERGEMLELLGDM